MRVQVVSTNLIEFEWSLDRCFYIDPSTLSAISIGLGTRLPLALMLNMYGFLYPLCKNAIPFLHDITLFGTPPWSKGAVTRLFVLPPPLSSCEVIEGRHLCTCMPLRAGGGGEPDFRPPKRSKS